MEFEYGQIESIEEPTNTYITLVIKQKVAYGIKFRKFNVWKVDYLKNNWVKLFGKVQVLNLQL